MLRSALIVQVCYHELTYTTKEYMSCVSAVDPLWLAELVRRACGELTASLMASYSSREFSLAFLGFRLGSPYRSHSIRLGSREVSTAAAAVPCSQGPMFFSVKESYADRLLKRREEKLLQKQMDDDMRELAREDRQPYTFRRARIQKRRRVTVCA